MSTKMRPKPKKRKKDAVWTEVNRFIEENKEQLLKELLLSPEGFGIITLHPPDGSPIHVGLRIEWFDPLSGKFGLEVGMP